MRIYGVDFTSRPTPRKPITCATCNLDGEWLRLLAVEGFETFDGFEALLRREGPWVAGCDFPFGQPRCLIENLGWPKTWAGYVAAVARLPDMPAWEALLATYREGRPAGDKQHLRETDRRAGARSPMMLFGVPVGRMFFRGAPRLLEAGVSIVPCRAGDPDRIVLETYPALAARRLIGRTPYKSDDRRRQTGTQRTQRRALLRSLSAGAAQRDYGMRLDAAAALLGKLEEDPSADGLDALLCALQAAWAWGRRERRFGIPAGADTLEGWIVDPGLAG